MQYGTRVGQLLVGAMANRNREFVQRVQAQLHAMAQGSYFFRAQSASLTRLAEDGLSDDIGEQAPPIMLPPPDLGNLPEIENMMRAASSTPPGREALARFVLGDEYIRKLLPLVELAEDLESVSDLHRLCSIMKILILLNDTAIIESCVNDEMLSGVVGALECMGNGKFLKSPLTYDR